MTTFCGTRTCGRLAALCTCLITLSWGADPALTIYNQNFAVIRENLPLDLKAGSNQVRYADVTAQVEPNSVILRDPTGRQVVQVLEQNYRNDPVSQQSLLNLYEGKTIEFASQNSDGSTRIVIGKIVRSGYVSQYQVNRPGMVPGPVIEVDGKLHFTWIMHRISVPNVGPARLMLPMID